MNTMYEPAPARNLKEYLLLAGVLLGVLAAAFFAWNYSFINIRATSGNPASGDYIFTIENDEGTVAEEVRTASSQIKRLVPRGKYMVAASQANKGSVGFTEAGGFLKTTQSTLSLSSEKSREFVGDNPSPCMYYTDRLYSYECGGFYGSINEHVPATASTPSYTRDFSSVSTDGVVEGLIKTAEGNIMLMQPAGDDSRPHVILLLDNALKPVKSMPLTQADINTVYAIRPYRSGFIIYDPGFEQVTYYSSLEASPQNLDLQKPADASLKPAALSTNGDSLSVVYSDNPGDAASGEAGKKQKAKNTVMVRSGSQLKQVPFNDGPISSAVTCGDNMLCVVSGKTLHVLDISGDEPSRLQSLGGVEQVEAFGEELVVARGKEILSLNFSSLKGAVDYSYGEYGFCGLQRIDAASYSLCLIDGNEKTSLRIDRTAPDKDSIDKKITKLKKSPLIDSVSVNKSLIYISPELGEPVYIESIGGYGYDPGKRKEAAERIRQLVDEAGIDRGTYTIINTLQ